MAKYNIYAVAYGLDPKTQQPVCNLKFRKWEDCKPYVVDVKGARYKGFLTETEADEWLAKTIAIPFEKNVETLRPSEVKAEPVSAPKENKESFYDPDFHQLCVDLGILPSAMVMYLQRKFVEQQKAIKSMQDGLAALKSDLPFV